MLEPRSRPLPKQAGPDFEFASAVIDGLSKPNKTLPCRFFYDARGSELFEQITRLPEYYLTRTETTILDACAPEMAVGIPKGAILVEFGSGSSRKTEILLRQLSRLGSYVAVDVSDSALQEAKARLALSFPSLDMRPVVADFSYPVSLPAGLAAGHRVGFFPGSTIGNVTPAEAVRLLGVFRTVLSPGGRLIVGVDLKKDARRLVSAYDDAAGVTAAFNLNLLARINRELDGSFDLAGFTHKAVYNPRHGRIEMHLESTRRQEASIRGRVFRFGAGECIHTENSYKYAIGEFQDVARSANWHPQRVWTDKDNLFSVHELMSG